LEPERRSQEEKMSDNIPSVSDASFQADVIEASKTQPVMVDFWADWCRPCKMLTPTVEEIAREHAGKLKVVKLNIDDNMGVPGKFNIRGIPTLLVFKGGQVADQIVGAVPKEQIVKVIERHIA
jgi:thioredoxin 1